MPILVAGGENLMRLLGDVPANGRGLGEGTRRQYRRIRRKLPAFVYDNPSTRGMARFVRRNSADVSGTRRSLQQRSLVRGCEPATEMNTTGRPYTVSLVER